MKSNTQGLYLGSLERHPLVLAYVKDDRRIGVTLVPGHAFSDATSELAEHTVWAAGVKEALAALKWAEPCRCPRCLP